MQLSQRIQSIMNEQNISQSNFAKTLGVTSSYINLLVNNRKRNISSTLAKLIEETYGYSAQWVLYGTGEKYIRENLTNEKKAIIENIKQMSDSEVNVILAFLNLLDSYKK